MSPLVPLTLTVNCALVTLVRLLMPFLTLTLVTVAVTVAVALLKRVARAASPRLPRTTVLLAICSADQHHRKEHLCLLRRAAVP